MLYLDLIKTYIKPVICLFLEREETRTDAGEMVSFKYEQWVVFRGKQG